MHLSCASCASSAETILQAQEGVINASVNFANESALIEYAPNTINKLDLQKALQAVGFDLVIDESPEAQEIVANIQTEHLKTLQNRTLGAVLFSLPVVVWGMFFMEMPYANQIMWAFSTPVVVWFGQHFFVNAWRQARNRTANMDTLVALSTGVAYIFSVFNTLFPHFWHARGLHAHVYFEASAAVIAFVLVGKLLEERAKSHTSSALKKLIGLQPKTVTIVQADNFLEMPIDLVQAGHTILVKAGERVAVDGEVVSGNSYIDESMMTGEPIPVPKEKGDKVFAGTINQKGTLQFRATQVGKDTRLAGIIRLVQEAQGSKAPVQKLADQIAGVFVPVVMGLALLTLLIWVILGGENGFTHGLLAMVTVLVIACPCALGLATPTAIMVGVGKGAEKGILIKDAESLELAQHIEVMILDKTGTITEGKPTVTNIFWAKNADSFALSSVLCAIEKQSEHPLAEAITQYFASKISPTLPTVAHFESITGKGAKGTVGKDVYFVGKLALLRENNLTIPADLQQQFDQMQTEAKTLVWFADTEQAFALVAIADQIKATSAQAIAELQRMGIEVVMLTGDNHATAKAIAEKTGIKYYQAEVLPAQKAEKVKEWQAKGKKVGMVGDGINDSAALAQADVGIAMGKGADIAIEVAKMTIISSDLLKLPQAIRLSKQTVATIKQNLFWAFIYNLIGIPIAMGILYPFNGFLLNPMIASMAMALSSISVVSNSLRLKYL